MMLISQSADTKVQWWTLKQIYRHYLVNSQRSDGKSAEEVIQACFSRRRFEDNVFQRFGMTNADRGAYQDHVKSLDALIEKAGADVRRLMLEEAEKEDWVALGRRSPDSDHELIPPRYWPFLTLDIENNAVTGEGMMFRDLRCRFIKDIPDDDPVREALDLARKAGHKSDHNDATGGDQDICSSKVQQEHCVQSVAAAQTQVDRTGAPGRPSSMHLVEAEFAGRCRDSRILASLRAEAEHLAAWCKANHPSVPCPTARTVENRIRADYRRAKHAQTNRTK